MKKVIFFILLLLLPVANAFTTEDGWRIVDNFFSFNNETNTASDSQSGSGNFIDSISNLRFWQRPLSQDLSAPSVISTFLRGWENETSQFTVLNETTSFPIEKFNITTTITDLDGATVTDVELFWRNTNGTGITPDKCPVNGGGSSTGTTGNKGKQLPTDPDCHEWLSALEGRDTGTMFSGVTVGDGIEFTNLSVSDTSRTTQYMIDEVYKNVQKDYPFNASPSYFDNGTDFKITKNNYRKWSVGEGSELPSDASFYQFDLRMQVVGTPQSLHLDLCNSTYTTGDPDASPNCANLGILVESDGKSADPTKYRVTFGNDTIDLLGNNISDGFVILHTAELNPQRYYGLTYFDKKLGDFFNRSEYSTDSGATWLPIEDKSDAISLHWFYGDATCFQYFFQTTDSLGNIGNSSVNEQCWRDFTLDDPPSEPQLTDPLAYFNVTGENHTITWDRSSDPEGDDFFYEIALLNEDGTFNLTITDIDTGVTKDTESYFWDITSISDATYNMTIKAVQNETNPGFNSTTFVMRQGFFVNNTIPAPNNLLPLNDTNYTYPTGNINFNFSNSSDHGNDILFYYVEWDDNNDFSSPVYVNTSITGTDSPTGDLFPQFQIGTYYWRVLATDGIFNSSWSDISSINILTGSAEFNITTDGIERPDCKYEFGTTANITVTSIGEVEFCVSFDNDPDFGVNFTCGLSPLNVSYKIKELQDYNLSDNISWDLVFGNNPQLVEFNITNYSYSTFKFNLSGEGIQDTQCDFDNDGIDLSLPGELQDDNLHLNTFSNNLENETITYLGSGNVIRNLNLSIRADSLLFNFNGTMNLTGTPSNPETLNYQEFYWNASYINLTGSDVDNEWRWETFDLGDISGRWSGTYTITDEVEIRDSQSLSSTSCAGDQTTGTNSFFTQTAALEDYGSTFVEVTLDTSGCCQSDDPPSNCGSGSTNSGSGTAIFILRDKTTGTAALIIKTVQGGASCTGVNGDSGGASDTSVWEIRKVGSNFEVYDDGVLSNTVAFDSSHQYELETRNSASTGNGYCPGCGGCGSGIGAQGTSLALISYVNKNGIAPRESNNFTWDTGSVTSINLKDFSSNISTAKLTATELLGDNTNVSYFLSADNGTWESVQNGVTHVFDTEGPHLKYMVNVSGTNVQGAGELAVVTDLNIEVSQGFPSNISIDVCNDGTVEWDYPYELNDTQSVIANFSSTAVSSCLSGKDLTGVDTLVDLSIRSNSSGGLNYKDFDFNTTLIDLNYVNFIDNLTELANTNSSQLMYCSIRNTGTLTVKDYDSRYKGDGVIAISAHTNGTSNNITVNDTYKTILARYSPVNFSLPFGIDYVQFVVHNYTQFNVTPYGQEEKFCDNSTTVLCYDNSTGIYNYTTLAKLDPVNITVKLNTSIDSCLIPRFENNLVGTFTSIVANTTQQRILNFIPTSKVNYIWRYLDVDNCNRRTNATKITPVWGSYCEECVFPTDIDGLD